MICEEVRPVYWAGWTVFLVMTILCYLFGAQRGIPLRKLNFHLVAFSVYLLVTFYSAGSTGYLCWKGVVRDDGLADVLLARPLITATIMATLSVLVTYRLKEPVIDVIMHACIAIASQVFWVLAIVRFESKERSFWAWISAGFSLALIFHMWVEGRSRGCVSPKFARSLILKSSLYILFYYVVSVWGPYFEHIIGATTQEIIMMVNDSAINLTVCVSVLHYGWAERNVNRSKIKPGKITDLWFMDRTACEKMTQNMHLIDV